MAMDEAAQTRFGACVRRAKRYPHTGMKETAPLNARVSLSIALLKATTMSSSTVHPYPSTSGVIPTAS